MVAAEGVATALALGKNGRPNIQVALAAPAAILLGNVLKHLVHRPRPVTRIRRKGMQSFPSTHVAGLVALLTCTWQLAPPTKGWRTVLLAATTLTAGLGVERVCSGAHWPSDVAVGAALGAVTGALLGRARPKT